MAHSKVSDLQFEFAPGSSALLSDDENTDRAVVFVHGFGGHPRKTWVDFHTLIDSMSSKFPWWGATDLYFFKYRSVADHIDDSSGNLEQFFRSICPEPPERLFVARNSANQISDIRSGHPRYNSLVLAAHSEGAVVARLALINFVNQWQDSSGNKSAAGLQAELILKSALRLFAPAHLGASPSGLLGVLAASGGIGDIVRTVCGGSPAYNEMQQGSTLLDAIREDTLAFADRDDYKWMTALHALVVWGEDDLVVTKGKFRCDRRYQEFPVPGKGHVSVCKPKREYMLPLEFVSHAWDLSANISL